MSKSKAANSSISSRRLDPDQITQIKFLKMKQTK